jgi:hypothetical protein
MTEQEIKWIEVKAMLQDRFGKVPDLQSIIFLIGINEVGFSTERNFEKEEKENLMHVAMCTLLSYDGFYEYTHHDEDGWPHFEKKKEMPGINLAAQEKYLKEKVITYFGI